MKHRQVRETLPVLGARLVIEHLPGVAEPWRAPVSGSG
jgi:hypothetical protein